MNYLDYAGLQLYHQNLVELLGNISESINNGTLTIKKNNTSIGTFSANQSTNSEINISVPTNISDLGSVAITEILNIIKYGRPDVSDLTEEEKSNLEKYGQTDVSGLSDEEKQALEEAKIEALKDALNLEKVAFTGDYSDLYNLPVIYNILEIQNIVKYGQADISGLTQEQLDNLEKYGVADTTPYTKDELEAMAINKLAKLGLHEIAKSGSYNDLNNKPTSLPASDVYEWAKTANKPNYTYSEVSYPVETATSTGGTLIIDGSKPLHIITLTGNVSGVTLSTTPASGHSTHVIFTATTQLTVFIAHDATVRVCPNATTLELTISAGGYAEVDFLNTGNKIFVRGI